MKNLTDKWITGFSDGESSFGVYVYKKDGNRLIKLSNKVIVSFSISQDEADLAILKELKEYFQVGFIYKDSGNRSVWVYKISSYRELSNIIIPFFTKNSLYSSKLMNFLDLKRVVTMMNNKQHLSETGLEEIKLISKNMNTKRDYSLFERNDKQLSKEWILGFIDAEGCFYFIISYNKTSQLKYKVNMSFSISQHCRDKYLLEKIQNNFQCGNIIQKKDMCEYRVVGIKDLSTKIIPFFTENKLKTSKNRNYEYFTEVLDICIRKEHLTLEGLERIKKIKIQLNKKTH